MVRGVRWYLLGLVGLVALAGCGRGLVQYMQREPWRAEAEVACMQSGTVREGRGLVRIEPIEGPGICGATYPLKVAALGESSAFGYADETIRPPGSIPGASQPVEQPRWPVATPRSQQPAAQIEQPRYVPSGEPRMLTPPPGAPLSISPPGVDPLAAPQEPQVQYPYPQRPGAGAPPPAVPQSAPLATMQRPAAPPIDEDDEPEPRSRGRPATTPSHPSTLGAPLNALPNAPVGAPLPALGPQHAPKVTGAVVPVEIKPAATLACPIVSALDQWVATAVQPAAHKWFGQPVVEIKQISAYSCRGMNGQIGARISEHAFGNALDIAAFVLADGHRITVKAGWQGSPEEQGFLRDVQGAACDQFTTVLAPGSNRYHYDHIHVDLMRRASGRRICQPGAVDGELVAARARKNPNMMAQRPEPPPTRRYDPPFDARNDPFAWRGDAVRRGDPTTTGSIGARRGKAVPREEDEDWVEHDGPRERLD